MKKLVAFLSLLLAFTVVLAACGSNEKETNNASKSDQDLYEKVKEDGVLTIGTEGTYPPFTFHDDSNKLTGFDVEIAQEVAKRLGVKAEFKETQWDGMFAGLDAKRFDMIANQVGIRPDREEKYDFSDPYIESAAVLVVREDNNEVKSFEDMKGKKSAQSLTSNYADLAKKYEAELVGVEGFTQSAELIVSKRVDGTINDKLSFLDYKKQRPNAPVKIVDEAEDASASGLMFRKDSGKLVEEVNKALADMQEDGTYAKISEKWFGEDVSPK
ncbi:amino acid ABC transporter substrate-binding protein [Priestia aryabhattai]|uniref:amino acid ABC transporter substrate-binding protein n=1 Tax=Priestia TaxID=2800373 RepID=UPI000BA0CDBD|nr:amino acid ABC transporter substrate-binding protein [Priestia flexa]MBY6024274.1 amino acid ABC transporter substrate-binding protein [Nitratireductor sp. DP7N14-4]MDT2048229.1 amino acid ABC transporter substrate-binding protein [Priestia flexa]OZT11413.1 amino acid ABC transporter substrate-binding protein [Priestia aryabhattai]